MQRRKDAKEKTTAAGRSTAPSAAGPRLLGGANRSVTSPASGGNVQLGQTLGVTVAASGGTFQMVLLCCTNPLATTQALASPPYQFPLPSRRTFRWVHITRRRWGYSSRVPINIVGSGRTDPYGSTFNPEVRDRSAGRHHSVGKHHVRLGFDERGHGKPCRHGNRDRTRLNLHHCEQYPERARKRSATSKRSPSSIATLCRPHSAVHGATSHFRNNRLSQLVRDASGRGHDLQHGALYGCSSQFRRSRWSPSPRQTRRITRRAPRRA
jgi:hypothetical protein